MKLLSNSSHSINPLQKCLLYKLCTPTAYHMKTLNKMQRHTVIWILGTFKTFPSCGVEAIASLIPIKLHLQKLGGRSQL